MLEQPNGFRPEIRERGLGEILGDAFSIYAKGFRGIVAISAIVQIPTALLALLVASSPMSFLFTASVSDTTVLVSSSTATIVAVSAFVSGLALMLVHFAVIAAVGQSFAFGRIDVGGCWTRVAWRGVTISAFALFYGAISAATLTALAPMEVWSGEVAASAASAESGETPVIPGPPLVPTLALLALAAVSLFAYVYMPTIAPTIAIEGRRGFGAVSRGFRMARGSEWRILGHVIIYTLTMVGLTIAILIPFGIVAALIGGESPGSRAAETVSAIGAAVAGVLSAPLLPIAATLLYFDIRLKKEGCDAARLSAEMGARTQPRQASEEKEG